MFLMFITEEMYFLLFKCLSQNTLICPQFSGFHWTRWFLYVFNDHTYYISLFFVFSPKTFIAIGFFRVSEGGTWAGDGGRGRAQPPHHGQPKGGWGGHIAHPENLQGVSKNDFKQRKKNRFCRFFFCRGPIKKISPRTGRTIFSPHPLNAYCKFK